MYIFVWNKPVLWSWVYPQSLQRLVLESDLSASNAESDQRAQDEYQQQSWASDPAGRDIRPNILVFQTGNDAEIWQGAFQKFRKHRKIFQHNKPNNSTSAFF
jgi:hypothetical protein